MYNSRKVNDIVQMAPSQTWTEILAQTQNNFTMETQTLYVQQVY